MPIEMECPNSALLKLFDSSVISSGMTQEVPGGATIHFPGFRKGLAKRHVPGVEVLETVLVTFGSGVAINLFASWLYDKLKSAKVTRVRINKLEIEVTADGITKLISESVEIKHEK